MDRDEFWEKDLLRANKDLLFSCYVHGPPDSINGKLDQTQIFFPY